MPTIQPDCSVGIHIGLRSLAWSGQISDDDRTHDRDLRYTLMEGRSLAAAELFMFLGLVGWLLYYQFSTSKRRDEPKKDDKTGSDDPAV